jgi:hypothetical protein
VLLNSIGFVLLGPPIAYAVIIIVGVLVLPFAPSAPSGVKGVVETAKLIHALFGFAPVGLFIAYMHGTVAAAITGGLVGLASARLNGKRLYAFAAVTGAIASVCTNLSWLFTGLDPFVLREPWFVFVAMAVVGAIAGMIVTRALRSLRLRLSQDSVEAVQQ